MWRTPCMLVGLTTVLVGCETTRQQTQIRLVHGEQAYRSQRYASAVEHLTGFIAEAPNPDAVARARYVRGMAAARLGRRELAYTDLREAATAGAGQIAWSARAVLGVLHFEDEEWASASLSFRQAIDAMPDVAPKDALLYRLGLCRERMGQWSGARTAYHRVVTGFPRGPYAGLAARRLQLRADHYAVQCGVFARVGNAQKLATRLRSAGFDPVVREELRGGRSMQVVLVGQYTRLDAAKGALAQVKNIVPEAVLWP